MLNTNQPEINLIQNIDLIEKFIKTRALTESLCEPLEIEDYGLQAMVDTSPVKWHLAHTSWFFETFILRQFEPLFVHFNEKYEYLFNSYYNGIGQQFPRSKRALMSRPTVEEVYKYRKNIDERMSDLLSSTNFSSSLDSALSIKKIAELTTLGINHEQQHQELILTDLLYNLSQNPLFPHYQEPKPPTHTPPLKFNWVKQKGGLVGMGLKNSYQDFAFDNEFPQHQVFLSPYKIANRLTTNGEYLEFIKAGGYQNPNYWLSDGWTAVSSNRWTAPLYWQQKKGAWYQYSLNGLQPLNLEAPVSHVSAYEADAYARWANARLLTEAEWEHTANQFANSIEVENGFLDSGRLVPALSSGNDDITQLFGELWQWTSSSYGSYPGFRAVNDSIGEYNGKFMCNQLVLRGGSCVTSRDHIRSSYRNFFYPDARWQFSGIRLAKDNWKP